MKTAQLVVNESYWHLFDKNNFRTQEFLIPESDFLRDKKYSSLQNSQNLGVLLKIKDTNRNSIYGAEIKTNGSNRSGRIPLVRITETNQSIWKITTNIRDVDKAITDLDSLLYFLNKSRINTKLELPHKVLVTNFNESEYLDQQHLSEYVKKVVAENDIIWVSSDFLTNIFENYKRVDISEFIIKKKTILTKETFL